MREPIIDVRNLQKTFDDSPVLCGVDLRIEPGETVVVVGRSGCGKTVLLKHLVGLIRPEAGSIRIDGVEITRLPERELNTVRLHIGMLFQEDALFDSLSVYDNVGFALAEHTRLARSAIRARVRECLELVGLGDLDDTSIEALSGGMKKRVALARAIAIGPSILLYDEPTSGVDPNRADAINALIRDLARELNVTSVVVTHNLDDALAVADRIVLLKDGVIAAEARPDAIEAGTEPTIRKFFKRRSQ